MDDRSLRPPKGNCQAANRGESFCSSEGYYCPWVARVASTMAVGADSTSFRHRLGWVRPLRRGGRRRRDPGGTASPLDAGEVRAAQSLPERWGRGGGGTEVAGGAARRKPPLGWSRGSRRRPGHRSSRCSNGTRRSQRSPSRSYPDAGCAGWGRWGGCEGAGRFFPTLRDARSPPSRPHPAGAAAWAVYPVPRGPRVATPRPLGARDQGAAGALLRGCPPKRDVWVSSKASLTGSFREILWLLYVALVYWFLLNSLLPCGSFFVKFLGIFYTHNSFPIISFTSPFLIYGPFISSSYLLHLLRPPVKC